VKEKQATPLSNLSAYNAKLRESQQVLVNNVYHAISLQFRVIFAWWTSLSNVDIDHLRWFVAITLQIHCLSVPGRSGWAP